MSKVDWKDVLVRAVKTFIQTALSYIIASVSGINFFDGDKAETFWIGLMLSAVAAGLSAAWNAVLQPLFDIKRKPVEEEPKQPEEVEE